MNFLKSALFLSLFISWALKAEEMDKNIAPAIGATLVNENISYPDGSSFNVKNTRYDFFLDFATFNKHVGFLGIAGYSPTYWDIGMQFRLFDLWQIPAAGKSGLMYGLNVGFDWSPGYNTLPAGSTKDPFTDALVGAFARLQWDTQSGFAFFVEAGYLGEPAKYFYRQAFTDGAYHQRFYGAFGMPIDF